MSESASIPRVQSLRDALRAAMTLVEWPTRRRESPYEEQLRAKRLMRVLESARVELVPLDRLELSREALAAEVLASLELARAALQLLGGESPGQVLELLRPRWPELVEAVTEGLGGLEASLRDAEVALASLRQQLASGK